MEAIHTQEAHPAFRGVFSAGSSEDLAQIYDLWAVTYDNTVAHDLAGGGENHPTTGLAAGVNTTRFVVKTGPRPHPRTSVCGSAKARRVD